MSENMILGLFSLMLMIFSILYESVTSEECFQTLEKDKSRTKGLVRHGRRWINVSRVRM